MTNFAEIDEVLGRGRATTESHLNGRLDALADLVVGESPEETTAARLKLTDSSLALTEQALAGASLLRLLNSEGSLGTDQTFNGRAIQLFDRLFDGKGRLYSTLGITHKYQAFQKLAALLDVASQAEEGLAATLEALQQLRDLARVRNEVMQYLNTSSANAVLVPFLPDDVRRRLDDLFRAVENYGKAKGEETITTFERAMTEVAVVSTSLAECGSRYALELMDPFVRRFEQLVRSDFEANPVTKPAQLAIKLADKRYPLAARTHCNIQLVITNSGPGVALDTAVELTELEGIESATREIVVGEIAQGDEILTLTSEIKGAGEARLMGVVRWRGATGEEHATDFLLELEPQTATVDWNALIARDPYAPEPVSTEEDLVGRRAILNRLIAQVGGASAGSSFVTGQKRVGKTSIVRTLANHLKLSAPEISPVVIETGDIVRPDSGRTVAALGDALTRLVGGSHEALVPLSRPSFDDALAPLTEYLEAAHQVVPSQRFVFVIDEFDELPLGAYERGGVGDSFFLTLRALAGREYVGLVLVGGEKIDFILKHQGERLNKFDTIRVDYFDRGTEWSDFARLAQDPVDGDLEYTEGALIRLFDWSAGNPFFAKLVCRSVLTIAADRRDAHVTETEVSEAVRHALSQTGIQNFQHFWDDGIPEEGDHAEKVAARRRKVILALGEATREARTESRNYANASASEAAIAARAAVYGLDEGTTHDELRDLARRGVLVQNGSDYACRVPFFSAWLQDYGVQAIITSFGETEATFVRRQREEAGQVVAEEIVQLADRWGTYRGRRITEDLVRGWLRQFGDNVNQRLMFRILEATRFYGGDVTRAKLREVHSAIERATAPKQHERLRRRYVVSHVGGPAKSGATYARLYAQENRVGQDQVVERGVLRETLSRADVSGIRALVFAEDLIGTGGSVAGAVQEIADECGDALKRNGIPVYFVAVCGFGRGIEMAREALRDHELAGDVLVGDPLGDEARVFHLSSGIFASDADRELAKQLAEEHGVELEPRYPLGFGGCEAAVVFEQSCPNNSLPILWQKAAGWRPLFPRF